MTNGQRRPAPYLRAVPDRPPRFDRFELMVLAVVAACVAVSMVVAGPVDAFTSVWDFVRGALGARLA